MAIPPKTPSDDLSAWIMLSHRWAHPSHPRGAIEVQSIGTIHLALQDFELRHTHFKLNEDEAMKLALDGRVFYELARLWVLGVFALAHKIERGHVIKKRNIKSFKGYINPLRNAFEKGYVDQDKERGVYPELFFNIDPFHCIGWVVPNKEGKILEFYRAEIAQKFFNACQED